LGYGPELRGRQVSDGRSASSDTQVLAQPGHVPSRLDPVLRLLELSVGSDNERGPNHAD